MPLPLWKLSTGMDCSIFFQINSGGKHAILYYSYVKNLGKPMELVEAEIEKIKSMLPEGVTIEKIAVTGSGRERVGKAIGARLIINEITAQTEGAVLFHPETETIFEIGGQDSKYMSLKNGKMAVFEMNKVCAAGTGAFLEEQIKKLGISMAEFLELAMKSENPCALGDRCTVFIESSITKAMADGSKMEDVCAGLAYAIANNYLNRVINLKPIGDKVAIQGGIAYNEAVMGFHLSAGLKAATLWGLLYLKKEDLSLRRQRKKIIKKIFAQMSCYVPIHRRRQSRAAQNEIRRSPRPGRALLCERNRYRAGCRS